jgi:hypothetical protein
MTAASSDAFGERTIRRGEPSDHMYIGVYRIPWRPAGFQGATCIRLGLPVSQR